MDLIKKLTGKNPSEYEPIAKSLVDNSDVELFKKLVSQDDFLFDFIKENVAKRIQRACNKENYRNLLNFLKIYSEKAYAVKYFSFADENLIKDLLPEIRKSAKSEFEGLFANSIEILSALNDDELKKEAIEQLDSEDEFEQYEGVKFLSAFGAKDTLPKIIEVMKKSSFSENIASEIFYLVSPEELLEKNYENGLLVLAHIINSIPEIIPLSAVCDYDLKCVFEEILSKPLDSASAVVLRMAKDKFEELTSNDEYLFDSDKSTKDGVNEIARMLKPLNNKKLNSFLYDELYEESDFVFFALDFVNDVEELETLLESENQTLALKVLTILKEKGLLSQKHKDTALIRISNPDLRRVAEAL